MSRIGSPSRRHRQQDVSPNNLVGAFEQPRRNVERHLLGNASIDREEISVRVSDRQAASIRAFQNLVDRAGRRTKLLRPEQAAVRRRAGCNGHSRVEVYDRFSARPRRPFSARGRAAFEDARIAGAPCSCVLKRVRGCETGGGGGGAVAPAADEAIREADISQWSRCPNSANPGGEARGIEQSQCTNRSAVTACPSSGYRRKPSAINHLWLRIRIPASRPARQ